jgi:hypothetical protein
VLAYAEQGITGRNNKKEFGNLTFSCCPLFTLSWLIMVAKCLQKKEFFSEKTFRGIFTT